MQILIQPMYSKQEINADSNYVVYTAFVRAMLKARPDWHFVLIFPDANSGYKYEPDGFFDLPNITRLPQRISPRKMSNAISFDGVWYDTLARNFGFDLIWCNLVEVADRLVFIGEGSFEKKARPIVVAAHNYMIHDSLPYPFERMVSQAWAQCGGAMFSDWNVFNSDHCQQMFIDTASKWLTPEAIAGVLQRSTRIDYGTLESGLTPVRHHNAAPIIAYNHRLMSYKKFKETFELFAALYDEGYKFTVRYMNNSPDNIAAISHYPFVEIRLCADRKSYLAALRECDLNVTNSVHETFCIAAIESMALGQPLIAPDGVTFPQITNRDALKYPFLYHTTQEQKTMLVRLLQNEEERQAWGRKLSRFVNASYNSTLWVERYAELFERLTDMKLGTPEDTRAEVRRVLRENNGATALQMKNAMQHIRIEGRQPLSNQSLTLTKLVRLAREEGARVVIERAQQRFYADNVSAAGSLPATPKKLKRGKGK